MPRNGCRQQYALKSLRSVSEINARVRSRAPRKPASIASFSAIKLVSSGTGDFRRITRVSTSHSGKCRRFGKGTGIGAFCVRRSTVVTTPRSTTTRCETSSAADHSFNTGQQSHLAAGIASAARKKTVCARASFSRIGWSDGIRMTLNCCAAGFFKRIRQLQHPGFAERRPKNLQPYRQLSADPTARHRNPRQTRQRPRNCINISKIHL